MSDTQSTEDSVGVADGWTTATSAMVCDGPQYGWTTSAADEGEIKLLRTTDISSNHIEWDKVPYCLETPTDISKHIVRDNDLLISRAGSVGVSLLVAEPEPAIFASYLIRFRPLIEPRFVRHFLASQAYWDQITEHSAGIAIPNVNARKLASVLLPVAPLNEQRRIVEKIDELFSQIEAGEHALVRAQTLLERYRQSILNAAVTGELTRERREQHKGALESGGELLARILQARRETWEKAELAKMHARGKPPTDDRWKQRYREPEVVPLDVV